MMPPPVLLAVDEAYFYAALEEAERGPDKAGAAIAALDAGVCKNTVSCGVDRNSMAERLGLTVCTFTLLCVGSKLQARLHTRGGGACRSELVAAPPLPSSTAGPAPRSQALLRAGACEHHADVPAALAAPRLCAAPHDDPDARRVPGRGPVARARGARAAHGRPRPQRVALRPHLRRHALLRALAPRRRRVAARAGAHR